MTKSPGATEKAVDDPRPGAINLRWTESDASVRRRELELRRSLPHASARMFAISLVLGVGFLAFMELVGVRLREATWLIVAGTVVFATVLPLIPLVVPVAARELKVSNSEIVVGHEKLSLTNILHRVQEGTRLLFYMGSTSWFDRRLERLLQPDAPIGRWYFVDMPDDPLLRERVVEAFEPRTGLREEQRDALEEIRELPRPLLFSGLSGAVILCLETLLYGLLFSVGMRLSFMVGAFNHKQWLMFSVAWLSLVGPGTIRLLLKRGPTGLAEPDFRAEAVSLNVLAVMLFPSLGFAFLWLQIHLFGFPGL